MRFKKEVANKWLNGTTEFFGDIKHYAKHESSSTK